MLLFSRVATLVGNPRKTIPWAIGMNEYVNAHSDFDMALWMSTFGHPLGTVGWSTVVESEVALAAGGDKLLANDEYFDLLDTGAEFLGQPGQDLLRELIDGAPSGPPPVGAVATITTAAAVFDRLVDAIGWGVDVGRYVAELSGTPISVLRSVYGQMGELTWIGVQPDIAAAEAVRTKLGADAGYIGRMVATKDLFLPGSGQVAQWERIA
jgi:hypothetical protein